MKMKKSKSKMFLIGMIVLGLAFMLACSSYSSEELTAVTAAKQEIKETLRNPNTVQWNSVSIYDEDANHQYIVEVDYSAQNAFGGYNRSTEYVFIRTYPDNINSYLWLGTVTSSYEIESEKKLINWTPVE